MSIQQQIEQKLRAALAVTHLEVANESDSHSGPPGRESHFRVVLVSPGFAGRSLVQRHQQVYGLLKAELAGGVHALALHTYTEAEWQQRGGDSPASPNCQGGSKGG